MKRRITRISVEKEREVILGARNSSSNIWCARCGKLVGLIEQVEATAATELIRPKANLTKPDNPHLAEVVKGRILICPNSQDQTKKE